MFEHRSCHAGGMHSFCQCPRMQLAYALDSKPWPHGPFHIIPNGITCRAGAFDGGMHGALLVSAARADWVHPGQAGRQPESGTASDRGQVLHTA